MGHAQGPADQQAQRADRAAQHQVAALAAKQRVAGEADAQAQVAGDGAGRHAARPRRQAQFVIHHPGRDAHLEVPVCSCSPLPPQPPQGPVLR